MVEEYKKKYIKIHKKNCVYPYFVERHVSLSLKTKAIVSLDTIQFLHFLLSNPTLSLKGLSNYKLFLEKLTN